MFGRVVKFAAAAAVAVGSLALAPAAQAADTQDHNPWPHCLDVDTNIHIWDQTTAVHNGCNEAKTFKMVINNQPDSPCYTVQPGNSVSYKYLRNGQFATLDMNC